MQPKKKPGPPKSGPKPLTERHRDYAALRAQGNSQRDAARMMGVSDATACRWERRPDVTELIVGSRELVVAQSIARLGCESLASVRVLAELRDDPEAPAAVRIGAATTILKLSLPDPNRAATVAAPIDPDENDQREREALENVKAAATDEQRALLAAAIALVADAKSGTPIDWDDLDAMFVALLRKPDTIATEILQ